jgi:saccharopine dehydrogenase-like NADP-dependent oxidoreductase
VARILVLGGAGEMGSVAVTDLLARTDHEVVVGDLRPDAAAALGHRLGRGVPVRHVDVEDPVSLAGSLDGVDVVVNATYMRTNVGVARAAIDAAVHLVDLGSYYPETLQQLDLHDDAVQAGARVVPGCGVAPGLTNVLARDAYERLDRLEAVRMYSYITHPMTTSPGIVVTRFDASTGTSVVLRDGALEEHPSFSGDEEVEFPPPYGRRHVHLVPHPEPVTLPRYLPGLRDVVFKVGYPEDENRRIAVLLDLGFDREEPFVLDGVPVLPRAFAAAYVGWRGIAPGASSANVKRVVADGERDGRRVRLVYDFAVEQEGASASSVITGTLAAVAADVVAQGGSPGVLPPEAGLPAGAVLDALAERGLHVRRSELPL